MAKMACIVCDADEFGWVALNNGYDALACVSCGEPVPDDGTTETRVWVGH